jgi:hypothetical protein
VLVGRDAAERLIGQQALVGCLTSADTNFGNGPNIVRCGGPDFNIGRTGHKECGADAVQSEKWMPDCRPNPAQFRGKNRMVLEYVYKLAQTGR